MSTPALKPFSLQAPERIAMEYGGNKQKIAQAVQSGLIDPTSGLLAGMFIDRVVAAQIKPPTETVKDKTFPHPQGPQGGPPPGGPQGGPPPGAPPMQMASAAPPPGGPPPQGPVGMAEGGLTSLPVPDYMFDEQTFAGGGIVAFAPGGVIDKQIAALQEKVASARTRAEKQQYLETLNSLMEAQGTSGMVKGLGSALMSPFAALNDYYTAELPAEPAPFQPENTMTSGAGIPKTTGIPFMSARTPTAPAATPPAAVVPPPPPAVLRPRAPAKATTPDDDYGLPKAPDKFNQQTTFDDILKMMGPAPKATTASAEEKAKERNYDIGMAMLSAASAGLAKGSKTFLGALGDAGEGAMPVLAESAKARRAAAKEERQAQFEQEKTEYGARGTAAAATRAEKSEAQKYELTLAGAKLKAKNDADTLALEVKKARSLAGYYRQVGRDKDAAMVDRLSNALRRVAKNPNDADAKAEVDAIQRLQGRASSFAKPMTYNAARDDAVKELKNESYEAPTEQQIHARTLLILSQAEEASGGGDGGGAGFDPTLWGKPQKVGG